MDGSNSLVPRVIQAALPTLSDHARVLQGLGGQVSAARGEFVASWKAGLERVAGLARTGSANEIGEEAMRAFIDPLGTKGLDDYLRGVAGWSETWRARGASFADSLELIETMRRTLVPFLLRMYTTGPELELVFRALDALERATVNVLAAAEIQATQLQLAQGAHLRTVGRLTGGVAHALNNNLAIIVGRAQILEEQMTDESQRAELREIQRIARTGGDSLRRLQKFALDREPGEPARLDVNGIVNEVVQLTRFRWRDDAEAGGIEIEVARDLAPVSPVIGHAAGLRDALVELILNAVEVMPMGGLITLRTEQTDDRVRILVIDRGLGMEESTLGRATEPLFTTKGQGHVGLGLTTVKGLVLQMGGTLALESIPGHGTTATISLAPAREIQQAADYRPTRVARWAKILVVDDEPMVRDVAARSFQLKGFQTIGADSGADAIRIYSEQGPFEVAIVDLGMPRMNGFETARALKQLNPRTIVILMTGWSAELDTKKMREAGVDRAIAKPFDVDQVIQLISEALAIQEKI